jgi:site-specific recombinase XerC
VRLIRIAGVEGQLGQRRWRERLQTPKAQHTRKHLRPVPDSIADAALQLAKALPRPRPRARTRPSERPDRGAHEGIRLTYPAPRNRPAKQRVRVPARGQRFPQRRCDLCSYHVGGTGGGIAQLGRRQPQNRTGRSRLQPHANQPRTRRELHNARPGVRTGDMQADMTAAGVGDPAIRKVLTVLQSIPERAVEWRHLDANPVRAVRKPGQQRTRVIRPLSPTVIETMRAHLLATDHQADATLISVLAYAGLRPGEAIGLRWHDVGERTLLVERSVAFGQLKSTKTASSRSVRLLEPLREDLTTWHRQTTRDAETDLIFPAPDGSPWSADRARNWRKRGFADAAEAAGVPAAARTTCATATSASSSPREPPSSRSRAKPGTPRR